MLYKTIEIGGKEYKLRLNARMAVQLEEKLGCNPLDILTQTEDGKIPKLSFLLSVLHASLQQYHHGITMNDVYKLFDVYTEEDGGTMTELLEQVMDVFECSGYFKREQGQETAKEVEEAKPKTKKKKA